MLCSKVSVDALKSPSTQYRHYRMVSRTTYIKNVKFNSIKSKDRLSVYGLTYTTVKTFKWAAGWAKLVYPIKVIFYIFVFN